MPATIVSYLPYDLTELKPGITPALYTVKKGDGKQKFGLTVIPDGAYHQINPDPLAEMREIHWIQIPVPPMVLAQSIIMDYATALLEVELPDAMPGLCALPGEHTDPATVRNQYAGQLKVAREQQTRWFQNLINLADDTYAKSKSPLAIHELSRMAADAMELKREWLFAPPPEQLDKCPVCLTVVNPGALMCPICRYVIRPDEYRKLQPQEKKAS